METIKARMRFVMDLDQSGSPITAKAICGELIQQSWGDNAFAIPIDLPLQIRANRLGCLRFYFSLPFVQRRPIENVLL